MEVNNGDAKAIVSKAQQEVGGNKDICTVTPQNEAVYSAFGASSSGVSNFNVLIDHSSASELKNLQPTQIDVTTLGNLPIELDDLNRTWDGPAARVPRFSFCC